MRGRLTVPVVLVAVAAVALGATAATGAFERGGRGHVSFSHGLPAAFLSAVASNRLTAANPGNPANLPADCIPPVPLPGHLGELGLVGVIGLPPLTKAGSLKSAPVSVPSITAKICGTVTLTEGSGRCPAVGTVTIPKDGQEFGRLVTVISIVPGMYPQVPFVPAPSSITGSFQCNSSGSSTMGLTVSATASVGGSAGLFGLGCSVQLSIPLSATVTGPIDDQLDLRGEFESSDFEVPAVQPSSACPQGVASNLNKIVGLPLPPGSAAIDLPFATALYAP